MKTALYLILIGLITLWLSDRAFQDEVTTELMKAERMQRCHCYVVEDKDGSWKYCRCPVAVGT
jgi:hypothetical protein